MRGTAGMGTMLVETGSIWRRIFLLDSVTASEEKKQGSCGFCRADITSFAPANSIV